MLITHPFLFVHVFTACTCIMTTRKKNHNKLKERLTFSLIMQMLKGTLADLFALLLSFCWDDDRRILFVVHIR